MRRVFGSIAFNIAMFSSGAVLSLIGLVCKYAAPAKVIRIGQLWARFNLAGLRVFCGIKLELQGAEHLPKTGGVIIAAQHQSAMDIMIWLSLLHEPAYVLKRELLNIPLFGPLMLPAGMIAVDRDGGAAALKKMVVECRKKVEAGKPLVIFPEGTRVAPGARVVLQPGIVALARALNAQVVPAATDSGLRWSRKAFWKNPGPVKLRVFAPLPPLLGRQEMIAELTACFYERGVE
jgi:1-acyl-sn-glycerol-3-phosphate acyltransferase